MHFNVTDTVLRPRAKINSSAQPRARAQTPTPRLRARVNVPQPPRSPTAASPPTSTLSFSSRDDDDLPHDHNNNNLKAKAKSNRKIADLEITNRSLLAINASLESTKHKQAKEIRDLRRKLRESRLILPSRPYSPLDDDDPPQTDDEDDNDDIDTHDEVFVRIKSMLDNLLQTARTALQTQPSDFLHPSKVLSPDELRSWNDDPVPDIQVHDSDRLFHYTPTPSPPPIRIHAKG